MDTGRLGRRPPRGRSQGQAHIAPPARSATVVAVAILDITGLLVTVAAALVLTLNDEINRRWWLTVGVAFLLAVLTTVLLIRVWNRRQSFVEAAKGVTEQLEGLCLPQTKRDRQTLLALLDLAQASRKAAQASGDLAEEMRLAIAIARFS
jgi:hypothetical protein